MVGIDDQMTLLIRLLSDWAGDKPSAFSLPASALSLTGCQSDSQHKFMGSHYALDEFLTYLR